MKKEDPKMFYLTLSSIVAIVAIVGIVMILGTPKSSTISQETADLIGQAFRSQIYLRTFGPELATQEFADVAFTPEATTRTDATVINNTTETPPKKGRTERNEAPKNNFGRPARETITRYDAEGNIVWIVIYRYRYDGNGKIIERIEDNYDPNFEKTYQETTRITTDENGNKVVTYERYYPNKDGEMELKLRIVSTQRPDGKWDVVRTDSEGNITRSVQIRPSGMPGHPPASWAL